MKKEQFWDAACEISEGTQFMCHAVGRSRTQFEGVLREHGVCLGGGLNFVAANKRRRVGTFGEEAREVRFMFLLFLMHSGVAS